MEEREAGQLRVAFVNMNEPGTTTCPEGLAQRNFSGQYSRNSTGYQGTTFPTFSLNYAADDYVDTSLVLQKHFLGLL